jgi:hypothetical protein
MARFRANVSVDSETDDKPAVGEALRYGPNRAICGRR